MFARLCNMSVSEISSIPVFKLFALCYVVFMLNGGQGSYPHLHTTFRINYAFLLCGDLVFWLLMHPFSTLNKMYIYGYLHCSSNVPSELGHHRAE